LSILKTYKAHKISAERRKFTNELLKNLRYSKEKSLKEGEIYCIEYRGEELVDKWHVISVSLVHEILKEEIVVHNLLYLREEVVLELLKRLEKAKQYSTSEAKFLVERELSEYPWACTKVTMRISKIGKIVSVPREKWGMLPLMEKHLFGNLNPIQLSEDWKKQHLTEQKVTKSKKEIKPLDQEVVIEDIEQPENFAFEEVDTSTSLADVRKDILDDDDNDI
jgi:hypothetical protein